MAKKTLAPDLARYIVSRYMKVTTPVFDKEMGARLKIAREKMGLTQRELGDKLGQNQTLVCRLESGKQTIAPFNSDLLNKVLGEHFEYVILREGYYKYEEIKWRYHKQTRMEVGSRA